MGKLEKYKLILYISGRSASSKITLSNLEEICEEYLAGNYRLKIIDIDEFPELVEKAGIMAIPTMIKESPFPRLKLIGTMSDKKKVLIALGILENKK